MHFIGENAISPLYRHERYFDFRTRFSHQAGEKIALFRLKESALTSPLNANCFQHIGRRPDKGQFLTEFCALGFRDFETIGHASSTEKGTSSAVPTVLLYT